MKKKKLSYNSLQVVAKPVFFYWQRALLSCCEYVLDLIVIKYIICMLVIYSYFLQFCGIFSILNILYYHFFSYGDLFHMIMKYILWIIHRG